MIKVDYVWLVNLVPGLAAPNHTHNCYEIIYYYSASGHIDYYPEEDIEAKNGMDIDYLDVPFVKYNEEMIKFENNSLVIIPPHTVHNEFHNHPAKVIDIGFHFENPDTKMGTTVLNDTTLSMKKIIDLIEKEYENKNTGYDIYINSLVNMLIVELTRLQNQERDKKNPLSKSAEYIKEHFAEEIDLEKLAEMAGYGLGHFRFLFNETYQMSPKAFIIKTRINNACKLLKETTYNVQSIAKICGYDDMSQFTIIFKKKIGVTPSQYRETNK